MHATKEQIIKNYWNFYEDLYLTFAFPISVSLWKHSMSICRPWFCEECVGDSTGILINSTHISRGHAVELKAMGIEFTVGSYEGSILNNW